MRTVATLWACRLFSASVDLDVWERLAHHLPSLAIDIGVTGMNRNTSFFSSAPESFET